MAKKKCCEIVFWKHDDGWDAYLKEDCTQHDGEWIPDWFDCAIVEDARTLKEAKQEIAKQHVLGICLVK